MSLQEEFLDIDGVSTRVLSGGKSGGEPTLLLHGGLPGLSPFCGGAHLWGPILGELAKTRWLIVPDMPGSGNSGPAKGALTIDALVSHTFALLDAKAGGKPVHIVGHDLGGMVALATAMAAPKRLLSLSIVASNAASPTGDGVENLTLKSPPAPLWSKDSQFWAYDRLSYSHHHIDDDLLEASVAAAKKQGHHAYAKSFESPTDADLFTSIMKTKSRFFRVGREEGIAVPTQIIWAKNDPLVSVDHGLWLHRIIAAKQRASHFHLINRSGSFPFREQPEEFLRVLTAFQDGLVAEAA